MDRSLVLDLIRVALGRLAKVSLQDQVFNTWSDQELEKLLKLLVQLEAQKASSWGRPKSSESKGA